ncbi:MAG: AAA family ATPase [Methylococcales bacterium]
MINIYEKFYSISVDPFRLSADHNFSYGHPGYQKALTYMNFALYSEEGFIVITGQPGTGKTTLINDLVSGLDENKFTTAHLVTTQIEAKDLLHLIAASFGLETDAGLKSYTLIALENFLKKNHSAGKRALLFVDEVQCLKFDSLEELRLLSNIHHEGKQLLQVFLIGQEEFRDQINAENLEQLRQRIIGASHLNPLTDEETIQYIIHRLKTAGWKNDPKITKGAALLIHHFSGGIPRIINQISSRLLLHGCIEEKHELDSGDMLAVLEDLKDELIILDKDISIKEVIDKLQIPSDREYLEAMPAEELEELLDEMEILLDKSQLADNDYTVETEQENILDNIEVSTEQDASVKKLINQSNGSTLEMSSSVADYAEDSTHQLPINEDVPFISTEERQLALDGSQERFRHFVDQLETNTSNYNKFSVFGMKFKKIYGFIFLLSILIAILVNGRGDNLQLFIQ